jgi:hypothetical protein
MFMNLTHPSGKKDENTEKGGTSKEKMLKEEQRNVCESSTPVLNVGDEDEDLLLNRCCLLNY